MTSVLNPLLKDADWCLEVIVQGIWLWGSRFHLFKLLCFLVIPSYLFGHYCTSTRESWCFTISIGKWMEKWWNVLLDLMLLKPLIFHNRLLIMANNGRSLRRTSQRSSNPSGALQVWFFHSAFGEHFKVVLFPAFHHTFGRINPSIVGATAQRRHFTIWTDRRGWPSPETSHHLGNRGPCLSLTY